MKDEYDFSTAKRGAIASSKGKTRITIMLDDAVIQAARDLAESAGTGYQTMINNLLRSALLPPSSYSYLQVSENRSKVPLIIPDAISRSEIQALELQLLSLAAELKRVLGVTNPPSA